MQQRIIKSFLEVFIMKNKIYVPFLIISIVFFLAACTSNKSEKEDLQKDIPSSSQLSTEQTSDENSDKVFKFEGDGTTGSITGGNDGAIVEAN
jgi:uncharacterized protein YpmB